MTIAIIGSILIAILGYLTQISIFPAFGATAIAPNMIIALAVVFAMAYGPWPALAMGFFGGILVDLMVGGSVGISSLVPILVGFMVGIFKRELNSRHFLWAMIYAFLAYFLNDLWYMLAMYFARIPLNIGFGTFFRSLLSATETGLFAGGIFILVQWLLTFNDKRNALPYLKRF
jgi:rod shape-determining protein MreD